jgi:DNA-binding Lrp family transcriptional regulator
VKNRRLRLRGRDLDILVALAQMLLLSTSTLTRLFFDSKGTCQKRMRKLFDEGLVRAVVIDLAAENRYALTRLGYALLEKALPGETIPAFRSPPRVGRRGLAHLDLLNHVRIAVALGAGMHDATLIRFVPDWDLRSIDQRAEIIPDALIILRRDPHDWSIALEIDCSTESRGVFGRKLLRYRQCANKGVAIFGVHNPLVLVVAPTERRARTLAKQARESQIDHIVFSWADSIGTDGGIVSGLAYVEDLLEADQAPRVLPFSRGLMQPRGAPPRD